MNQATALNILKSGQNVFLTGSAGAGKTYTLSQYIHYLKVRKVPVAVTASTGIAATHIEQPLDRAVLRFLLRGHIQPADVSAAL